MRVIRTIVSLLRPSARELSELVRAEMDPARAPRFEQLCFGPLVSAIALAAVVLCAAVLTPFRLVVRLLASRR